MLFSQAFKFTADIADHCKRGKRFFGVMHNADTDRKEIKLFRFAFAVGGNHISVGAVLFVVERGSNGICFGRNFLGNCVRLIKGANDNKIVSAYMPYKRGRVLHCGRYNNLGLGF